jgi:hypothetical protein
MPDGGEQNHAFKLTFNDQERCEEVKKVIDVGVAFARLSHDLKINYEGRCHWRMK